MSWRLPGGGDIALSLRLTPQFVGCPCYDAWAEWAASGNYGTTICYNLVENGFTEYVL